MRRRQMTDAARVVARARRPPAEAPRKVVNFGRKNFVTYTVLVAVGGGDAVAVRRRFSDFEKLYKSFVVRFGSTGMVVPSLFPRP